LQHSFHFKAEVRMRFRLFVPADILLHRMLSRRYLAPALGFLACAALLASCRSPVPVWNEDGLTMTDLRTLRHHGKKSVVLSPGVRLFADEIRYKDKRKGAGEAFGHVLLQVEPAVRYEWMMKYGYAGKAYFDKKQRYVELAEKPMLERSHMTQIATEPYTTIAVSWQGRMPEVIVNGPTRTDFAKSHPVPPGVTFLSAALPVERLPATPPSTAFQKR
jgi:hypothetical protein